MTELSYYDTTIMALGSLFLGIIMLIKGGNWAVDSAAFVAYKYKIPPMVIGFTIIAFGTSLPELVVSVLANIQGSPGISLGNVIGSNIANILMVLGLSALFIPLITKINKELLRDLSLMVVTTIVFAFLMQYGSLTRFVGFAMLIVLFSYVFLQYKTSSKHDTDADDLDIDVNAFKNDFVAYTSLIVGLSCIAIGAEFLVKGAQVSAELIGIPESVIALSIIALGTSLPELSTSIIAARKKQTDMVIGNIVGSNVFNILMIIGISASIKPILNGSFSPSLANFDSWLMLGVTLVFTACLLIFGRINRLIGFLFLLSYIAYNVFMYAASAGHNI